MVNNKKNSIYYCEQCKKVFSRKDGLTRHRRTVHEQLERYECDFCDFITTRKDTMKRHIREVHEGIRAYVCELCGQEFSQAKSLRRHINSNHTQEEKYTCQLCDTFFYREDSLKRHIQTVHESFRPYTCPECGSSFKLKQHLQDHIISIHTNQRSYVCDECGFAFKLSSHLNDHIRVVHQKHRPHVCEECDASFPHARDLKLHIIAVHTDEKPFVCEECGRGFADPSHLYKHKEAEACWFTRTTAYKWEELCKEIAEVLLADEEWYWKPRIDTPELEEQSWIQPEIVVYYENSVKRIIDAKRSTQAIFKEKDLVVYPKVAETVEFWCLYGKAEGMFDEADKFDLKDSEEIIEELKNKRIEKNKVTVSILLMKIELLKRGIDYQNQKLLE